MVVRLLDSDWTVGDTDDTAGYRLNVLGKTMIVCNQIIRIAMPSCNTLHGLFFLGAMSEMYLTCQFHSNHEDIFVPNYVVYLYPDSKGVHVE